MRALVLHHPKDLRLENRENPDPKPDMLQVRIEAGGICGSDLHYYLNGGFGTVRMSEPMILGHEVAGRVLSAPDDASVSKGDLVAVSPSRNCGTCRFCLQGLENHCENMRFYGSAMPVPHIQGAFRDVLQARPDQCHKLSPEVSAFEASCCEPLSVVLHCLKRAGEVKDRRILITGCGPMGALTLLAARAAGAGEITVTDVTDIALERALHLGADHVVNTVQQGRWSSDLAARKGSFDIAIEASGAQPAFVDCLNTLRPRGILMMLGLGGDLTLARNMLLAKEIDLKGTFRFHAEFADAARAISNRSIDLRPIMTGRYPLTEAVAAFDAAADRNQSLKIHLDFLT